MLFAMPRAKCCTGWMCASQSIVVTGGGIVLRTSHRELLRQLGTVVYLETDEETLFERISRRANRPLLRTEDPRATMNELLQRRLPLYEEIADFRIDTSRLTHDEVCESILQNVIETKKHAVAVSSTLKKGRHPERSEGPHESDTE